MLGRCSGCFVVPLLRIRLDYIPLGRLTNLVSRVFHLPTPEEVRFFSHSLWGGEVKDPGIEVSEMTEHAVD